MATSDVYIANLAIAHLGDGAAIASLTENTKPARYCNLHFAQARDETLAAQRWNFARKYRALADLGTPPAHWVYRYAYPADCITARFIVPDAPTDAPIPFELALSDDLESRVILTDREEAELCYTAQVVQVALFPPAFIHAMAWALAILVCKPLTGDLKLMTTLMQGYNQALAVAGAQDANEEHRDPNRTPDWLAARA